MAIALLMQCFVHWKVDSCLDLLALITSKHPLYWNALRIVNVCQKVLCGVMPLINEEEITPLLYHRCRLLLLLGSSNQFYTI